MESKFQKLEQKWTKSWKLVKGEQTGHENEIEAEVIPPPDRGGATKPWADSWSEGEGQASQIDKEVSENREREKKE